MEEDFAICVSSEPRMQVIGPGEGIPEGLQAELLEDLRELDVEPSEIRLEIGSAGYGAEILTVLEVIGGILAVGPLLEQNLSAWPRFGKRLVRVLSRQRDKGYWVSVSAPAALSLVLADMDDRGIDVHSARLVASHVLPVAGSSIPEELIGTLKRQPDRFYLFVLRVEDGDHHVVIARSSGDIEARHRLPTGDFMEYAGVKSSKG